MCEVMAFNSGGKKFYVTLHGIGDIEVQYVSTY